MEIREILSKCDHTLLAPQATFEEIRQVCDEGIRYGTASVCIPPCFVKEAKPWFVLHPVVECVGRRRCEAWEPDKYHHSKTDEGIGFK